MAYGVMDAEMQEKEQLLLTHGLEFDAFNVSKSPGCVRSCVRTLFGYRLNPRFAANAEVAFRGALFLLICSIPVIIPDGVSETRDMMIKYGIYNSSVCVFIVFNLGKTFGEAFDSAISGIKGTILAACMGWILYTISPSGYVGNAVDFWLGITIGSCYVCVIMLLNLNLTLQMFAISNFAGTWMGFLNPDVVAVITPPWAGNWDLKTDTLLQGLVCTGIGFITVMVATLLPYPLWSLTYVEENQLVMNKSISKVLHMMVDYYCQPNPNLYHKDAVLRTLRELQSVTDDNDPLIRAAWWECFGMGRTQLKRQVMHTMDQLSNRVYDLAFNAWSVSTANPILGPGAHSMNAELMQQVRPQTVELLGQMEDLLNILVQAIEDGQLTPEEGKGVEALLDKMRNLEKELATNFHQHRRSITLNQASRMYEDVRVAQVLHWSISRIVGEIVEVAEGVVKFSQDKDALPPSPETGGMMTMFEGLADKDHVLYAWRGISSYFICFTIGFFGFGEFISPRSAGIAATAPLLLSMYSGSALVNDLNRIQGLMLGNVLVRLLGGFVDSCDWSELVLHSLTTFLWTFGGLFVYFHSRIYSTVGILAAAFGASTLLGVSCNDPNRIGKRDTFDGLMMNCVAFMVTMMMDSLFHSERASDLAHKTLDQCWEQIFQSYKAILDTKTTQVIFHRSNARKLLLQARAMNQEASLEPRFWRIPWQHDLFASVCNTTENIVIALATLESAIAEHGRSGNRKFKTFVQLSEKATSTDNYGMFGDETSVILLIKFVCVRKLLKVFIHETVQKFEGFTDEDSTQQFSSEQQAVEEEFIRKTVPYFFGLEDDQAETSMSHDEMAHLSVVFAGFTRTTALLRSVQHTILSSHWQS